MEIKAFLATMGLGVVAGAAAALMIPKQSDVYQTADKAAKAMKQEVRKVMNSRSDSGECY